MSGERLRTMTYPIRYREDRPTQEMWASLLPALKK
jgi:hypothetical protein